MNGPHSVMAPGHCLQNKSVFAPSRYHENIGQGEMRWRLVLLLYSWRPVPEIWHQSESEFACCLHIMIPAPGLSLFCLQTKYNYGNFKHSLADFWYKQDRVTVKTVNSRHYQCEEGETEYLSLQCSVYHKRVLGRGRRGWENMFLFTSRQQTEQSRAPQEGNLRKAYKQTLEETSRNNFPLFQYWVCRMTGYTIS